MMIVQAINQFFETFSVKNNAETTIHLGSLAMNMEAECLIAQIIGLSPSPQVRNIPQKPSIELTPTPILINLYIVANFKDYTVGLKAIEQLLQFVFSTPIITSENENKSKVIVSLSTMSLMDLATLSKTFNEKGLPFLTLELLVK